MRVLILTTSLLVAVVRAVVVPVAHLAQGDTVSIITYELSRGAGGWRRVAQVIQLIRLVATVIVPVTDKVVGHAASILAGELMLRAWLIGTTLLITAVPTVITSITPVNRRSAVQRYYLSTWSMLVFHIARLQMSK